MRVSDVMTTTVATVHSEASIQEIATLMIDRRISGVPVVDAEGQVLGMVSEGDLIRRREIGTDAPRRSWLSLLTSQETQARDFVKTHGVKAAEIMTKPVHSVDVDSPVSEIAQIMERNHIKRLPVTRDGRLVGIVTRADLLRTLASTNSMAPPPPPASDRSIRDRLLATIDAEPWARGLLVNVIVTGGVVELWGVVDSTDQRRALRVAVEEIDGVKGVEDHLGMDLPT